MKNKTTIIGIIWALVIIAGIIVTAIWGFNFSFNYSNHKQINIYIGKEFENKDIYEIAKEVIGNEKVSVQKVELYEDIVAIGLKDITDEQLESLNTKINEKYGIENKVEDILITEISNVRGIDLVKPYILPVIISFVLIIAYYIIYIIIYKRINQKNLNITKAIVESIIGIVAVQLLYFSIIAITRLPINELTIPIAIVLYILTTIAKLCNN